MNYWINDNLIYTKDSIAALFEIEPIDVILLPELEQQVFSTELHRALNSIGNKHVQFIMRTRKALPQDLAHHFRNITTQELHFKSKTMQNVTAILTQKYVRELSGLLEHNIIPIKEYYIVFKKEVNTSKQRKVLEAIKQLDRNIQRFTTNLSRAGIRTKHITNYDLIKNKNGVKKTNILNHRTLEKIFISFVRP